MPITPTPRQSDFLKLTCEEALYGGAAGGGKSEALLMWIAEGIHIPTYSGIIFRRTFKQLKKGNEGLIAKSHRLYIPLGGRWNGSDYEWSFPSGAKINMGALEHMNSVYDYQGPSFHRIAFDEATQFLEQQYLYLFSRKRKVRGFPIELGMRLSANPGGIGHDWVKRRFVPDAACAMLATLNVCDKSPPGLVYWNEGRAFTPARLADNPFLDFDDYVKSLMHLSPVDRERLLNGDWTILENALIKAAWLRYYSMRGQIITLQLGENKTLECDERECSRFMTIDPAGTSEDKIKESKGKNKPYSALQIWDTFPARLGKTLILRHAVRKHLEFNELLEEVTRLYWEWKPTSVRVEDEKFGLALAAMLRKKNIPITTIGTGGKDKVTRAAKLLNMLHAGQVFLPAVADEWRTCIESEWLSWRGLDTDICDQVDAAAYAAIIASSNEASAVAVDFDFRNGTGGIF